MCTCDKVFLNVLGPSSDFRIITRLLSLFTQLRWHPDNQKLAVATLILAPRPSTCSSAVPAPTPTPTMAMSSDPAPERLEPDPDKQSSSLADAMAAVTVQDSDGHSVRNGAAQVTRTHPSRPNLSGRKLSLQERGTYSSSSAGRGYMSSREARRPTVESKRVSISDSQVSRPLISISFSVFLSHWGKLQLHLTVIHKKKTHVGWLTSKSM